MRCAGPSSTRRELKTRPDLVGLSGQSSGGHHAMLVAMRPNDPRYTAIPLPAGSPAHDASVRCVVMSWPVINPLEPLPPRQAAGGVGQSAGLGEARGHRAPGFLLAERGQHGRGQPDAHPRARREGADARRRSGSRPAAMRCTTTRTRSRTSPATSRSVSSRVPQGRRRDRARIFRGRRASRTIAGPVADRRHVRAHGGVRRQACEGLAGDRRPSLSIDTVVLGRAATPTRPQSMSAGAKAAQRSAQTVISVTAPDL